MELKETTEKILELFNADISNLGDKILEKLLSHDAGKTLKAYEKLVKKDKDTDWIQSLYEFFLSDREEKSQDYTPKTLSKLCAKLVDTNEGTIFDCCAGSGSLTLAFNENYKDNKYFLVELDENVIPFLLFNLSLHNISGLVVNGDALTNNVFKQYKLSKGKKFSTVTLDNSFLSYSFDGAISNPPFHLKIDESKVFPDFDGLTVPKSNQDYSFVLTCLENLKSDGKMAIILPNSVLTGTDGADARKYLVDNGYLDAVITCPDSMFMNTNISVTVLVLSKTVREKHGVVMVNERDKYHVDIRDMRGELHMRNRTYHKEIHTISDNEINTVCALVENPVTTEGYCTLASYDKIKENDYQLSPSNFIPFRNETAEHRSFKDIMNDINRIIEHKNSVKLTINETVAKKLMKPKQAKWLLSNKPLMQENEELRLGINENNELLKRCNPDFECPDMIKEDWLSYSKKKNMLKFENNNRTTHTRADMLFQLERWRTMAYFLNEEENKYLAEFRDALLPLLMSGELSVEEPEEIEAK